MCLLRTAGFLAVFLYTLLAGDRLPGAFSGACIALSALTPDWQPSSMAKASVTSDIAQTSYVLGDLPAKLTFDDAVAVDNLRYLAKLIFAELARLALAYTDDVSQ
jgi:hypothetical protein